MTPEGYWLFPLMALHHLLSLAGSVLLAIGAYRYYVRSRAWCSACLALACVCAAAGTCAWTIGMGGFGYLSYRLFGGPVMANLIPVFTELERWADLLSAMLALLGGAGLVLWIRRGGRPGPAGCREGLRP